MPRSEKTARRLVVDGRTFLWSLHHVHDAVGDGRYHGCCEILVIRLFTARGRLHILFRSGPDRLVPDGYLMPSGAVGTANGPLLNLHEPGTARAFLDEALSRGWRPDDPLTEELDGWRLFDTVATRRAGKQAEQPGRPRRRGTQARPHLTRSLPMSSSVSSSGSTVNSGSYRAS